MLNYEVPPEALEALVPAGVELDRWGGRLFVSVVGFLFANTRVLGFGVPGHRLFQEVNLRFYVRRVVRDEVRRGVVFVRELVPLRAVAKVARLMYNEPYRALPMRHRFERFGLQGALRREYAWQAGSDWTRISATTTGASQPLEEGSEAEFITEHYWGYTRQRDGSTVEYRVEHPRWNVWTATDAKLDGEVASVYGETFATLLSGVPISAFVADGSAVTVYWPKKIR
jgi:uncharacterized protein YqjF (DUF2071 family)